jgi:hypothetical protein
VARAIACLVVGAPDAEVFADRYCWPNGPAMNTAEITVMEKRVYSFKRHRIGHAEAERLADRLVICDREADDRVICVCAAYNGGESFIGQRPDCGSQLEFAESCVKCHLCGFSECG